MKPQVKKEVEVRNRGELRTHIYKAVRRMLRNKKRPPTLKAILMT